MKITDLRFLEMLSLKLIVYLLYLELVGKVVPFPTIQSTFPHLLNTSFQLQFPIHPPNEPATKHITDTMVIRITNKSEVVLERHIFNHGYLDTIDDEFKGKYMDIPLLEVDQNKIRVSIIFKRISHGQTIEIYLLSAQTKKERKKMLKNLKLSRQIYKSVISLYVPYRLELKQESNNRTTNQHELHRQVVATCRAYDGFPRGNVTIEIPKLFKDIKNEFDFNKNEYKISFNASKEIHNKIIKCKVNNISISESIQVLHPPSELLITPQINISLDRNTVISCYTKDGYPASRIKWYLIKGPEDFSKFFTIDSANSQLRFKADVPIRSSWEFNCSSEYNYSNSLIILNKKISFFIEEDSMNEYQAAQSKYFANLIIKDIKKHINRLIENSEFLVNKTKDLGDMARRPDKLTNAIESLVKENLKKIYQNITGQINRWTAQMNKSSEKCVQGSLYKLNIITNLTQQLKKEHKSVNTHQINEIILLKSKIEQLKNSIDLLKETKPNKLGELKENYERFNSLADFMIRNLSKVHQNIRNELKTNRKNEKKSLNENIKSDRLLFWSIDGILQYVRTGKSLFAHKDKFENIYDIYVWKFFDVDQFRIHLTFRVFPVVALPRRMRVTIQLVNSNNDIYVSTAKEILIANRFMKSPDFKFHYEDFTNFHKNELDSIIMKCHFLWM